MSKYPLLTTAAVGILLVAVAAAMPKAFPFLRGDPEAPVVLPDTPVVADYLIVAVAVLAVIGALVLRLSVASISDPTKTRKRKPVLIQVFVFVAVFWLIAFAVSRLTERREESSERAEGGAAEDVRGPSRLESETSAALGLLVTGGLVLAVGGLVAGTVYLARPGRSKQVRSTEEAVADEIAIGIEDIRTSSAPTEAVIACYQRMERVLVAAGAPVSPSDTPWEFIERSLDRLAVPEVSARRLTSLFERARFSSHPSDEAMRTAAISALEEIRSALRAEVQRRDDSEMALQGGP